MDSINNKSKKLNMANVTGKATNSFTYKGKKYKKGDDVTMDALHAPRHEKLNYVKFNREAEAKIETVVEKAESKKGK
jgi:hypothetical protein